jgi:hypothetical protein
MALLWAYCDRSGGRARNPQQKLLILRRSPALEYNLYAATQSGKPPMLGRGGVAGHENWPQALPNAGRAG